MSHTHAIQPALPRFALIGAALVALVAAPLPAEEALPEGSTLEEVQARQAANLQQAEFARRQLVENAANQAEYERKLAEVAAEKARIEAEDAANRAAFAAAQAKFEEEKARATAAKEQYDLQLAQHQAAVAKWEADVAACKAGDRSRCAD